MNEQEIYDNAYVKAYREFAKTYPESRLEAHGWHQKEAECHEYATREAEDALKEVA
tara:strand:+ start:250 stop:417 length:168 start_codon:yes stop_codon:yes gene_type:complete